MRAVALAFLAFLLLPGCIEASGESDGGGSRSESQRCIDGECVVTVCEDGECTTTGGRTFPTGPVADVGIQETHDLTLGLPSTTWSFTVMPNATGHVRLVVHDAAANQASIMANLCLKWRVWGPSGSASGNQGGCAGNTGISGTTNLDEYRAITWDPVAPGMYTIEASAQPQANELVVDIQVDNPEAPTAA